jgi:hypothetical protein
MFGQEKATPAPAPPSGLTHVWRLWRHCCCRYGTYPLLVAPLVTVGCLLDLYSSFDCEFVRVNIGFTPSNAAWNQSSVDLGLFFYQAGTSEDVFYRQVLVEGCRQYGDLFSAQFIDGDKTWEVARIMAMISGVAGMVATVTAWLVVVSPVPTCFVWPGILLPAVMMAFLGEGSKFLFFDTSICQSSLWFPPGVDSLPRIAKDCELGKTGYIVVAAGVIFFFSLLMVCLKAPEKRQLDDGYGATYRARAVEDGSHYMEDEEHNIRDATASLTEAMARSVRSGRQSIQFDPEDPSRSATSRHGATSLASLDQSDNVSRSDSKSYGSSDWRDNGRELLSPPAQRVRRDDNSESGKPPGSVDSQEDLKYNPQKSQSQFSQARLSKADIMQQHSRGSSDELIQKCIGDLTKSFLDNDDATSQTELPK